MRSDCLCEPGYQLVGNDCKPCQAGHYKPEMGNGGCLFSCPANADSEPAAAGLHDCKCKLGTHARLGASNQLLACVPCTYDGLECRGGFEGGLNTSLEDRTTRVHARPHAVEGYFQTAIEQAIPCSVLSEGDQSVCLGGLSCLSEAGDVDDATTCVGVWGNRCREGTVGMLCGECKLGWSRDAYPGPCAECNGHALPNLVASSSVQLYTQAMVNIGIAATAARGALSGSKPVHTSLLRMAAQWLAACSVITQFDLDRLPGFSWSQEQAEMDLRSVCGRLQNSSQVEPAECADLMPGSPSMLIYFSWPQEVSLFFQKIFIMPSWMPEVGSVYAALMCAATAYGPGLWPRDPWQARMVWNCIYYLSYP